MEILMLPFFLLPQSQTSHGERNQFLSSFFQCGITTQVPGWYAVQLTISSQNFCTDQNRCGGSGRNITLLEYPLFLLNFSWYCWICVGGELILGERLQLMWLSTVALSPCLYQVFFIWPIHTVIPMYTQLHISPAPEARRLSPGQPHPERIKKLSLIGRMSCNEVRSQD